MKAIINTIFCMVCAMGFTAHAQFYHPFPDSNAIWNTVGHNIFTSALYEFRFGLYGDTVINSTPYSKVYYLYDTTLISPYSTYFGAIREDENKKIYFLRPGYDETILYDFSAHVGDTIWYQIGGFAGGDTFEFWPQTQHYQVVVSTDSIQLYNNEYRKIINLNSLAMPDVWVEGIGSIVWFGLFNPIISDYILSGDQYSFACFRQNYTTLYLNNENCNTCYCNIIMAASSLSDQNDQGITLKPNPANDAIVIHFRNIGNLYGVSLYNSLGAVVYTQTDVNGDNFNLSISAFSPGPYVIVITDNKGKVLRKEKVIAFR